MKLRTTLAALITVTLAIMLLILSTTVPAAADPSLNAKEQALLQMVNEYRQDNGLGNLVPSTRLNAAADWFANDMASKGYFPDDHIDSLGRNPTQRGAAFGYPWGVGENLGAGGIFDNPQAIFNAWKSSPGHNANMLGSSYEMIGIAADTSQSAYTWYWVLDLGTALIESTPDPTPDPTPTPSASPLPSATPTPNPSPSPTPAPPATPLAISGDANCDLLVGSTDALTVLRSHAGYRVDSECIENGNVDCDDDHDVIDALAILRWIVSQPLSFDDDCPPIGTAL